MFSPSVCSLKLLLLPVFLIIIATQIVYEGKAYLTPDKTAPDMHANNPS